MRLSPRRAAFAAILLVGVLLRLWQLGSPSLWWDEANTMHYSRWATDPAKLMDTTYINEAPLLPLLVAGWNGLFELLRDSPRFDPLRDWWLRLLPCLAGIACMPLLHAVIRRVTGSPVAALVAMGLFAISPFHVHYAQELRVYSIHTLTGLCAAWCMLRAISGGRWPWWLAMVLAEALLFYGHYVSVWIITGFSLYFVSQWRLLRPCLVRWTLWHLLMMLLLLPGLYHAWRCNQHLLQVEYTWYPTPGLRSLVITFKNFLAGYGPTVWAYKGLLLLAAVLSLAGLWSLRRKPAAISFFFCTIAVPVAVNFFMWRQRDFSLYEDRLFILSAALWCGLPGAGVAALRLRAAMAGVLVAFTLLTIPLLRDYYHGRIHPIREHRLAICDKVDFRAAARFLDAQWRDGDFLAHDSLFTTYPMLHYLQREQAQLGAEPLDAEIHWKAFGNGQQLIHLGSMPVLAEEATQGRGRIWYMEAYGVTADDVPQSISIGDWLRQRYRISAEHDFNGIRLYLFEPEQI